MVDKTKTDIENVRTEYIQVCQHHGAVTDFRGKLLTLLPLASGTGIYLLIPKQGDPNQPNPTYLVAIGIFGLLVTLGLFLHELRGIAECGDLIKIGRSLEEEMGLPERTTTIIARKTGLRDLSTTSKDQSAQRGSFIQALALPGYS